MQINETFYIHFLPMCMDNKSPKYFITQTLWLQFSIDPFLEKIDAFYKSQNPLKKQSVPGKDGVSQVAQR